VGFERRRALRGRGNTASAADVFDAAGLLSAGSIFLLLALIALARIPSLEALRYVAPGEWGSHRILEVRTLRQKITVLCSEQGSAERWSNALAKQWMSEESECAGVF
jgi:hypothetical protein